MATTKDKGPRENRLVNSAVRMAEANAVRAEARAAKAATEARTIRAFADSVRMATENAILEAQTRYA